MFQQKVNKRSVCSIIPFSNSIFNHFKSHHILTNNTFYKYYILRISIYGKNYISAKSNWIDSFFITFFLLFMLLFDFFYFCSFFVCSSSDLSKFCGCSRNMLETLSKRFLINSSHGSIMNTGKKPIKTRLTIKKNGFRFKCSTTA